MVVLLLSTVPANVPVVPDVLQSWSRKVIHSGKIYRLLASHLIRYAYIMKSYGSLENYIKMNRQRVGLSQDELGLLIALDGRASVGRYELGLRLPQLETVLALEMVLGRPISDLFAGVTERVRDDVMSRARTLLEGLDDTPSKELVLKLELLSKLAHPDDHHVIPIWEEKA